MLKHEKFSSTFSQKHCTLHNFAKFRQNEHIPGTFAVGVSINSALILINSLDQFVVATQFWNFSLV